MTKLFFFLYFLDIKEQRLQMDTRQTCLLYLATISFFDLRERRIPNSITFGFFSLLILKDIFTAPSKISVSLACSAFFFTVFLAAAAATKGIGMGDIKLAAAIGYCSGFFKTLCSFIFASLGGIIFFMAMRLFNKGTSRIPFAPFAAAGYLLSELVRGEAAWKDLLQNRSGTFFFFLSSFLFARRKQAPPYTWTLETRKFPTSSTQLRMSAESPSS